MASVTSNIQLVKPSPSDNVDINMLNQNFDNIDNAIGELKTDYIIAQGVKDRWTYRKYASGIMECWGNNNHNKISTVQQYGNLFYAGLFNVNLPFAFTTIHNITATVFANNNGLYGASVRSFTMSALNYWIYSAKKEEQVDVYAQLHVLGRWK